MAAGGSRAAHATTSSCALEEPGDALVWKSARVLRRDGRTYGYVRLWGMSAETALAVVDMLLDREEIARSRPTLAGWGEIEGFLLDDRGQQRRLRPEHPARRSCAGSGAPATTT